MCIYIFMYLYGMHIEIFEMLTSLFPINRLEKLSAVVGVRVGPIGHPSRQAGRQALSLPLNQNAVKILNKTHSTLRYTVCVSLSHCLCLHAF